MELTFWYVPFAIVTNGPF